MVGVWKGEGKGRHEGRGRKKKITAEGEEGKKYKSIKEIGVGGNLSGAFVVTAFMLIM